MTDEQIEIRIFEDAEVWDKEMHGRKIYDIIKIQKADSHSTYPDEIILKHKGNIFFNWRNFLKEENHIVKEVFLLIGE